MRRVGACARGCSRIKSESKFVCAESGDASQIVRGTRALLMQEKATRFLDHGSSNTTARAISQSNIIVEFYFGASINPDQ